MCARGRYLLPAAVPDVPAILSSFKIQAGKKINADPLTGTADLTSLVSILSILRG